MREDAHFDIATIREERSASVAQWSCCAWGFCHALTTNGDDASCLLRFGLVEALSLDLPCNSAMESFETAATSHLDRRCNGCHGIHALRHLYTVWNQHSIHPSGSLRSEDQISCVYVTAVRPAPIIAGPMYVRTCL